jgi:hypothetical protein
MNVKRALALPTVVVDVVDEQIALAIHVRVTVGDAPEHTVDLFAQQYEASRVHERL